MAAKDTRMIAQTLYDAFNTRNFDRGAALIAENETWLNVPTGETFRGPAGYRQYLQGWATAFPDGQMQITNLIEGGSWVVVECIGRGTQSGPLTSPAGQIPP